MWTDSYFKLFLVLFTRFPFTPCFRGTNHPRKWRDYGIVKCEVNHMRMFFPYWVNFDWLLFQTKEDWVPNVFFIFNENKFDQIILDQTQSQWIVWPWLQALWNKAHLIQFFLHFKLLGWFWSEQNHPMFFKSLDFHFRCPSLSPYLTYLYPLLLR